MRFLVILTVLIPTFSFADFGIEFSYRQIPTLIKEMDHYRNSDTNNQYITYDYVHKNLQTGMISLYFGDSLRGRDDVKDDKPVTKTWLNPNRGAGYTFAFNILISNYGRKADLLAFDLTLGKRIVIIPHLFHIYGEIGPSIFKQEWKAPAPYSPSRSNYTNLDTYELQNNFLGVVLAAGIQLQVLKGIKFFIKSEFRQYGPEIGFGESNGHMKFMNKLPFVDKEIGEYYDDLVDNNFNNGREIRDDFLDESLRLGVRFTF
tara:strand:+ start:319 stop:1098 length:780 start_codon:yes stop_codon:yes gene_type:complete